MQFAQFTISTLALVFTLFVSTVQAAKYPVRSGVKQSGIATWFDGGHLTGAACYGVLLDQDVNARDSWHIAAIKMSAYDGGLRKACFQCVKVTSKKTKRSIIARVIDDCSSCKSKHVDLTTTAFKALAHPLKDGVVDISYEFVRCPSSGKWPKNPPVKKL
ncbi:hypothetical protein BX616_007472 [Lobosporangium transversale]|uniref:RlpA-like double-psi beta-barrel-protein domain-containing protein-containing protein n=1 Tax=Lobosporangium transversale TaxID=64571 RepID=A0A1Y2GHX2_9FUNG|nr:RlpA-like double-psi beta-barrel-protein domain-containing protein-containing protein [Lobosporangium transversale]KAF9918598.1 hypothetical protein BX616_007472 [Lobosporangium transversale]ORZ11337.1 RlpA-like double-psi beta-barrel-protein domain-containing protein-containing protein [Lobosporangium transversale]|eukprot:XP_021879652.1 RlpA-like double-psi beta-barrel-protein domain-containing protein-containing protein [Lobosporangium transversale]